MMIAAAPSQAILWSNAAPKGYHGFLSRNNIPAQIFAPQNFDPDL
ncbi:hypothetical protein [Bradyrhizobium sp. CSA207]|nr:hypothetical protein [Bradyrhizobium sp. CSA207]